VNLVTLQAAKDHLKPPGTFDDDRIKRIIKQASMLVLDYIKLPYDSFQDTGGEPIEFDGVDGVPPVVEAAVLLAIGALYDNADGQDPDKDALSGPVKSLLHTRRDPTLA
jgi:hypothetical protein